MPPPGPREGVPSLTRRDSPSMILRDLPRKQYRSTPKHAPHKNCVLFFSPTTLQKRAGDTRKPRIRTVGGPIKCFIALKHSKYFFAGLTAPLSIYLIRLIGLRPTFYLLGLSLTSIDFKGETRTPVLPVGAGPTSGLSDLYSFNSGNYQVLNTSNPKFLKGWTG